MTLHENPGKLSIATPSTVTARRDPPQRGIVDPPLLKEAAIFIIIVISTT